MKLTEEQIKERKAVDDFGWVLGVIEKIIGEVADKGQANRQRREQKQRPIAPKDLRRQWNLCFTLLVQVMQRSDYELMMKKLAESRLSDET